MENNNYILRKFKLNDNLNYLLSNYHFWEYLCNPEIDRVKAVNLFHQEIIQFAKDNENTCFCLYEEDKLKGFIGFQELEWDSNYFGFNVAVIKYLIADENKTFLTNKLLSIYDDWCKQEKIKLVYARTSTDDINYIHSLESSGFKYMENRFHLYLPKRKFQQFNELKEVKCREYKQEDKKNILPILENAFSASRFHRDKLTKNYADGVYSNWVESALNNHHKKKLVMEVNGKFAGFFFYYLRPIPALGLTSLWWDLALLSPEFKGKGLGQYFYEYIISLEKEKVDFAEGKFSLNNKPVMQIMSKINANLVYSELTFHKCFDK